MKTTAIIIGVLLLMACHNKSEIPIKSAKPNIILVMADDLGWGDVAYNGNTIVKTPHLDRMAKETVKLNRFYAAAPVCSPTRASVITGRHPYRMNIRWAGRYAIPREEVTLAELLKEAGYATGHFGKWHIGGLSKTLIQGEAAGGITPYSPPWENGFDIAFSTESMMPTYNPYYHVGGEYQTEDYRFLQKEPVEYGQRTSGNRWPEYYWTGPGEMVDEWMEGDDSKIIMDRAIDFMDKQLESNQPFLSVIWFHTAHTPLVAGNDVRALYTDQPMQAQHWFGAITSMDEQIGRLRQELLDRGIADNTILWFCSDNGPSYIHDFNSAGPFRGKKAELFEGGIRVPAMIEWPAVLKKNTTDAPISTVDILPTVLSMAGIPFEEKNLLDGKDISRLFNDRNAKREGYLGFQSPLPNRLVKQKTTEVEQLVVSGDRFKLVSMDNGESFQLYEINKDLGEKIDVSLNYPQEVIKMKEFLKKWRTSCRASARGEDYIK